MKIKFNYYLKIKKIMNKDSEEFEISEPKTLKDIFTENISEDILNQIDLSELLVICDGKNVENLDVVVEKDTEFSICPKIYGG